ncbi:MAG: SpoIIE family protein phosphatase [Acidobacteriota bacterium]
MEARDTTEDDTASASEGGGPRPSSRLGRLTILILLASAVLATEAGLIYFNVLFSSPVYHTAPVVSMKRVNGYLVLKKVLSPAVAAGGLRPGDELLALITDGRRIPLLGPMAPLEAARAVRYGEAFQVEVLRREADGRSRVTVVTYPAIPESARQSIWPWLRAMTADLLIFLACLAAALLIGISRPEDEGALAASLLFLCFASFTWHGNMAMFPSPFGALGTALWLVLYAYVTPVLLWFCLRFPSPSPIDRHFPWLKRFGVAFGGIFAAWNGILWWLQHTDEAIYSQYMDRVRYADWALDIIFCLLAVIGVAALLLNLRNARSQNERRRLGILLCGILCLFPWLLSYLCQVTLGVAPPLWIQICVSLAMLLFPLAFIYAVLRHRVFGIRVFLRRGIQFALLSKGFLALEGTAIFVALYYAAGPSVGHIAGEDRGGIMAVTVAGLTLVSVLGVRRFNGRVLVPIERRFFREAYDAREILTGLTVRVRRLVGDPDALATSAVETLSSTLHPKDVALFLRAEALAALPLVGERRAAMRKAASGSSPSTFLCFWRTGAADTAPKRDALALPLVLPPDSAALAVLSDGPAAPGVLSLDPKDRLSAAHLLAGRASEQERALLEGTLGARLLVPMSVGTDLLGFLCLGEKRSEEPYSREDLQLLSALAQQMADTLDHARLLHRSEEEGQLRREVEIAQQVQQNLLPRVPALIPGLDCAAACRPARYVGGDYYDFIRRGESSVGLALGDISGKGVSAALLMASLQATLREQAEAHGDRVSAIMAGVNRRLCDSAGEGRFATLFYGVLDAGGRTLVYASAGHNPPMLLRWTVGGTEVLRLPATGTIVGVFPEQGYGQRQLALQKGDVLVLFSDGVTEAMNEAGEFFEEERLQELLVSMPGRPASEIRDRVLEEVARFSGSAPQADDITLVVARLL